MNSFLDRQRSLVGLNSLKKSFRNLKIFKFFDKLPANNTGKYAGLIILISVLLSAYFLLVGQRQVKQRNNTSSLSKISKKPEEQGLSMKRPDKLSVSMKRSADPLISLQKAKDSSTSLMKSEDPASRSEEQRDLAIDDQSKKTIYESLEVHLLETNLRGDKSSESSISKTIRSSLYVKVPSSKTVRSELIVTDDMLNFRKQSNNKKM